MNTTTLTPDEEAKWQVVEQYYDAWRKKNFSNVKFAANFCYKGPGKQQFNNAKDFLASASGLLSRITDIVVRKRFIQGDTIAVFYDFVTDIPSVGVIDTAGLYTVKNGELASIDNYFDPTTLHAFRAQMANASK
jgi:hypothetical protein